MNKYNENVATLKPFLRWAGGKVKILHRLTKNLPADVSERTYHEPFLGAGSMFFALKPSKAYLSDANTHLISCYEYVHYNPDRVYYYLKEHARKTCSAYYYYIRGLYNKSKPSAAQAARFIYLNKTCFNGIFRVNIDGEFNVPYGKKEPPFLPTLNQLRITSDLLWNAELSSQLFEESLQEVKKGDFVYLDPPYPPLNGTSNFTHYTKDRFNDIDQERLANLVHELNMLGALVMISNADTPLIRKLYKNFHLNPLSVTRTITCKKARHKVDELVITNYETFEII